MLGGSGDGLAADNPEGALDRNHGVKGVERLRVDLLDTLRPEPVSVAERSKALAQLPPEGEVRDLDATQQEKVTALTAVLRSVGEDYEIKVIDLPQAFIGLHARFLLLISLPALELLTADQLRALAGHEVGHEYFWDRYEAARVENDSEALRDLETACDAVAVLFLSRLGLPREQLISALERVLTFNARFGVALDRDEYPSLRERREAVKRLRID